MKNLLLIASLFALISCSTTSDPEPVRKAASPDDTTTSGCGDVVRENDHANGQAITLKAELKGCIAGVALYARTFDASGSTISSFRRPTDCNVTEQTITFAFKGEKIELGLFPCGGSPQASGKPYTMTITQGSKVTVLDGKVGHAVGYVAL